MSFVAKALTPKKRAQHLQADFPLAEHAGAAAESESEAAATENEGTTKVETSEEGKLELVEQKPFGLDAALHAEEQRRLAIALMAVTKSRLDLLQLFCRYWRHRVGSESLVQSIQGSIDVHLLRQNRKGSGTAGSNAKRHDHNVGVAYVEALLRARLFPQVTAE